MADTYDEMASSLIEICDDKVSADKLRSMFKKFDAQGVQPKASLDTIEKFKRKWLSIFKRNATPADIKDNWTNFASHGSSRPRQTSGVYVEMYDPTKMQTAGVMPVDENKFSAVREWIDGRRMKIYRRVFGVPCQKFEDMPPWEQKRWVNFCISVGHDAATRIWRNFCKSDNSFYHQQPGLAIDKIWQHIGVLNTRPNHEGQEYYSADNEPQELEKL